MKRCSILCCCFLVVACVFAGPRPDKAYVQKDLLACSKLHPEKKTFGSAINAYLSGNWDACLLNAFKQLSDKETGLQIKDWCHYMRGVSFHEKQLFTAAERAFARISPGFRNGELVNLHLGGIALEKQHYRQAIGYFRQLEASLRFRNSSYYSMFLQDIGLCYLHLHEYAQAEHYLTQSIARQEKEADKEALTSAYMNLANLYYVQFRDKEAIPWFEKAYLLAAQTQSFELKQNAALNMAVVEENRHKAAKALVLRKEYETWHDSLNNQNRVWELAQGEKKVALDRKQRQIRALETENSLKQSQRNAWLISCIFLSLLIAAAIYFLWQQHKSKRIILAQKRALDVLNHSKDKLFSVISHDLRSSVSALKTSNGKVTLALSGGNFSEIENQLKVNSFITNGIYSLLDNLLNWAMIQTHQLYFHREPLHLSSVVDQVMLNYAPVMANKNMIAECVVSNEIIVEADLDSLKIVLRNLIDNAIKFSRESGMLRVYSLSGSAGRCELVVEDFGTGINENVLKALSTNTAVVPEYRSQNAGTGLGLQLCREMLEKNEGALEIRSQEGKGTQIHLYLPKPISHGTD